MAEQRWVEVFDEAGELLYARGLARRAAIRASLAPPGPGADGFRSLRTPAGAHLRVLTASRTLGPLPVRIRVARSEDGFRTDVRRLLLLVFVGIPVAVLAAAGAGRLLQPLAEMAARARTISAERLSERLPVGNPDDELGQLALVFNDTFARLETSFERLKQFTADASHELRTPLTAIRSVGEIGLREDRDAAGYREIIGSMLEEADRLASLVDTLLTLSRWESGRVQPAREELDLATLAQEVADQLLVLAEERGVRLDVRLADPLPIEGDPLMLRQAVMNVLDNAIKFTPEGSTVRVWASAGSLHVRLTIDDEGPGIPPAERDLVVERFYRLDRGRARAQGGAGLGLAIAHRAVTVNRGRLEIGENERGGARVTLVFERAGGAC